MADVDAEFAAPKEPTDAEYIADAKRWAAKRAARLSQVYWLGEPSWTIRGSIANAIDVQFRIGCFTTEDAAWLALGRLLARLREELET